MNRNVWDWACLAVGRRLCGMAVLGVASMLVLSGCSASDKEKPVTQAAARINKEEITVHQINYLLQQQRGLSQAQAAVAGKQVLERLIDQELALQEAQKQKLDRAPQVMQQIEAARREIIARAYVEKVSAGASRPTPEEIKAYYEEKPALFKERRIYNFQEVTVEAGPSQTEALRLKMQSPQNFDEIVAFLQSNGYKFTATPVVRTAEQLPLAKLEDFARMKEGESLVSVTPSGAHVVVLVGARSQPVDEQTARPAIELFLLNERKRKLVEDDLKALRSSAQIDYLGEYAKDSPQAVSTGTNPATPASSASPLAPSPASALSPPNGETLEKGLKGLK
jgi:EpsD family peptidyl-prolyl cis-trans isomerase